LVRNLFEPHENYEVGMLFEKRRHRWFVFLACDEPDEMALDEVRKGFGIPMPVGVLVVNPDSLDRERCYGVSGVDLDVVDDVVCGKHMAGRAFSGVVEVIEPDGFDIWMALFEQATTHEVRAVYGTTRLDLDHMS
jgi:hypothetical protein